jgi:glycosyltransferase involved in cell wall biosynthesis
MGHGVRGVLFRAHERTVLPLIIACADRVLVSSRDYAQGSALRRIRGALARVEVHPLAVDIERFHPGEEPEFRSRFTLRAGAPILLFVGGLDAAHHFKGLPILMVALQSLSHLEWQLVIVGDGEWRPRFEALARANALQDRVYFVGSVSDADLPRYYRAADLHLFPSTERAEAFGLVCLEAAASGIPTLASALPGVRTVVLDGRTGFLVPAKQPVALAEAIERALAHPGARLRMGEAARRRAEAEFDWEPRVRQLEETYRSAVRGAHRSARRASGA